MRPRRDRSTWLRVAAQLTDVASGYQLWSERFDREAIDLFGTQDEIAAGAGRSTNLSCQVREGNARPRFLPTSDGAEI